MHNKGLALCQFHEELLVRRVGQCPFSVTILNGARAGLRYEAILPPLRADLALAVSGS
jgi:hypothetical protein